MFDSIQSNTAGPSFFYLLMAATNFQRAGRARHPHARDALRDIGREYLAKAAPIHRHSLCAPDRRGCTPEALAALGRQLRSIYDANISRPLPGHFARLPNQLGQHRPTILEGVQHEGPGRSLDRPVRSARGLDSCRGPLRSRPLRRYRGRRHEQMATISRKHFSGLGGITGLANSFAPAADA
jgi:hypothetical protein